MPILFSCLACDAKMKVASRKAGAVVNCPRCKAEIRVPGGAADELPTVTPLESPTPFDFHVSEPPPTTSRHRKLHRDRDQ